MKKITVFLALSVVATLLCGCQTVKGAVEGGAEGAKKDWESAGKSENLLWKADAWVQEHLW